MRRLPPAPSETAPLADSLTLLPLPPSASIVPAPVPTGQAAAGWPPERGLPGFLYPVELESAPFLDRHSRCGLEKMKEAACATQEWNSAAGFESGHGFSRATGMEIEGRVEDGRGY